MPRVLKDITINEVSSVDRGAGRGVRVMLMKRDDDSAAYWKRDFSQAERDAAASSGAAMSDGSFPVKTEADLKNAIQAIGRAKDPAKAKAHIKSRAKALGLANLIPDTWKRDDSGEIDMSKEEIDAMVAKAVGDALKPIADKHATELAKAQDEIVLLKMTDAHKAYMAGCSAETQKTFKAMTPDERDAFMQKNPLKKAADAVNHDELTKRDAEIADLKKSQATMAAELAATRLEKAQTEFKKRAVAVGLTEADGELMRKAFSGDVEAQVAYEKKLAEASAALKKQIETSNLFGEFGTAKGARGDAYDALMAKAEELRKTGDGSKLTIQQAFAKVYEDPANRELVAEDKRKRLTVVAA